MNVLSCNRGFREGFVMIRNVGGFDRILRIVIGLILVAIVFFGPKTPWGWLGLIPLITGLVSSCPAYSILGVSTCAKRRP
jgi:ABC-type polysaccharide/polyol phosphate export permease